MKRRVLLAWKSYRLVGNGERYDTKIEKLDGRDSMGVMRWIEVSEGEWSLHAVSIFRDFAAALHRRDRRARQARYRRTGK